MSGREDESVSTVEDAPRISTGNRGLDDILRGGLDPDRLYLYEGRPGTGKTTLALQFLLQGASAGERTLYVTLSESSHELEVVARRHGWAGSICSNWFRRKPRWTPSAN